jgi:hypothetical protein
MRRFLFRLFALLDFAGRERVRQRLKQVQSE